MKNYIKEKLRGLLIESELKKALYGDSYIEEEKERLTNEIMKTRKEKIKTAIARKEGYKEVVKKLKEREEALKKQLKELDKL